MKSITPYLLVAALVTQPLMHASEQSTFWNKALTGLSYAVCGCAGVFIGAFITKKTLTQTNVKTPIAHTSTTQANFTDGQQTKIKEIAINAVIESKIVTNIYDSLYTQMSAIVSLHSLLKPLHSTLIQLAHHQKHISTVIPSKINTSAVSPSTKPTENLKDEPLTLEHVREIAKQTYQQEAQKELNELTQSEFFKDLVKKGFKPNATTPTGMLYDIHLNTSTILQYKISQLNQNELAIALDIKTLRQNQTALAEFVRINEPTLQSNQSSSNQ